VPLILHLPKVHRPFLGGAHIPSVPTHDTQVRPIPDWGRWVLLRFFLKDVDFFLLKNQNVYIVVKK
jgi:hypothetical protein